MRCIAITVNFQESTTILNAFTKKKKKKVWKLIEGTTYVLNELCVNDKLPNSAFCWVNKIWQPGLPFCSVINGFIYANQ